jgi:hypothetical protein
MRFNNFWDDCKGIDAKIFASVSYLISLNSYTEILSTIQKPVTISVGV